jgi:nucleoside-triphosphatase THEP1
MTHNRPLPAEWLLALAWQSFPPFGPIHKLPDTQFAKLFYLESKLEEIVNTIAFSLEHMYGLTNKMIIGQPGSGKTTFIYFMAKALSRKHKTFSTFVFDVIHINRLDGEDDTNSVIQERLITILKRYFQRNDLSEVWEDLSAHEKNRKIVINKAEDFIVANKDMFKYKMILLIDDIDETNMKIEDLHENLRYFYSLIECEQICKWLTVRDTSLSSYPQKFLEFIETKFPQPIVFPAVDLFGILNHRITATNTDGINPFIPELCALLLQVHNYDLRRATTNAFAFLEHLPPPKPPKGQGQLSADFIGNYFLVNFTKVMTQIGIFRNIYRDTLFPTIPLEKDVFLVIATHNSFPPKYIDGLQNGYRLAYEAFSPGHKDVSHLISINMDHIKTAIESLIDNRLIVPHRSVENFFRVTPKGICFVKFVSERLYTEHCRSECEALNVSKHPVFWKLASRFTPLFSD